MFPKLLLIFVHRSKSRSGIEITPVNGEMDSAAAEIALKATGKTSKLESALDRLGGLQKRKVRRTFRSKE